MLILLYSELVDLELVRKQSINFLAGTLYGLLRRLMLIWYLIWWYDGTFARWRYETLAIKIDWSNRRTLQSCLRVKNNYFWGHVMYEFDKLYWEFHKLYRMTKMSHLLLQPRIFLTQYYCDQIFMNQQKCAWLIVIKEAGWATKYHYDI